MLAAMFSTMFAFTFAFAFSRSASIWCRSGRSSVNTRRWRSCRVWVLSESGH
jgi:hypothetical protein